MANIERSTCETCGGPVTRRGAEVIRANTRDQTEAFIERDRLRQQLEGAVGALREIAASDPTDNALDPDRNRRIAREYIASLDRPGGQ